MQKQEAQDSRRTSASFFYYCDFRLRDFSVLIFCLFTYKMGISSTYSISLSALAGGPKKMVCILILEKSSRLVYLEGSLWDKECVMSKGPLIVQVNYMSPEAGRIHVCGFRFPCR